MSLLKHLRFLLLTLVAMTALAAFAAACGDDDEGGDNGGGGTPAATTPGGGGDQRKQGGEITVQSVEFASLDPHFSSFAQDISLDRMIWRGLYTLDSDNVPQPAMAASKPTVSTDGKTYTVKLKTGLKWSDGTPLLAKDFVAGIHRTCNPINAGEYEYVLVNIVGCDKHYTNEAGFDQALEDAIGVKAIDDTTVEFTLAEPQPTFPIILSLWMTFPVPTHLVANSSDPWPTGGDAPGKLAYNGPYILTAYTAQTSVTLEPNPNWSGEVKPTLDKINIKFIDDLAQAANAYRTGEVMETDVDLPQLDSLKSEFGDGKEYFKFVAPSTRGVEMQLKKPPLDKLEVRLALAQAIDREQLVKVVTQGGNVATTSWIPAVSGGDAPDAFDAETGFDPASAKEHLKNAGYPDGAGFPTLEILVGDSPVAKSTGEFLQQTYKTNLGIDTTVTVVDSKTRSKRFTDQEFELFPGGWIQDYPDPENWVLGQFDTGGSLNNFNCSDPDIDALITKARFNTNDTERRSQYKEINKLISTRICGIAPYWHENNHWLIKPEIVGMRENLNGQDGSIAGDWAAEYWGLKK